uniref:Protein kinase domain-containing protein n=1 Tax=Arcella intermedia TaxID=1963864 RepID=A0A6B2LBD3_9EUKA
MKRKLSEDTNHIVREIQTMRDCKHKYIVNFEECYNFEGTITVVMEYCDGGTLKDLCNEVLLDETEVAHFCTQILLGLQYFHVKTKKVHRDIKAENILLNLNGDVRIADLGLIEQLEENGLKRISMVGTSYWMSPEMINIKPYDYKIDIWSLGCVCFELCCGSPPYHQLGSLAAMYNTATNGAPHLADTPEHKFSDEISDFLDNCFQTNPELRPNSTELLKHPFLSQRNNINMKSLQSKLELVFIGSSLRMNGLI